MTEIKVFWEAHSQGGSLGSFIGPMSYAESTPRRRPWSPFISPSPACGGGQGGRRPGRKINNLRYADDTSLMAESEEDLKSLLMRVKEENEKVGLKFNIKKTKIIASSPITTRQIEREKVETVTCFLFLGLKIIADGDCSHEIQRHLFLGRKAMTNLDSILKSRKITLPTKVRIVKDMVFPVVMYGCENWAIKKAERWRIDSFKPSCWRRLLKVPWTSRRSNLPILKEINPKYSLEGLMLKLKLQLWPPDAKYWLIGKRNPSAGKDWRQKEKEAAEDEMVRYHHWLNRHEFEQTLGDSGGQRSLACCSPWGHKESHVT